LIFPFWIYYQAGISDLLRKQHSQTFGENTETQKVNWLELTDSQKANVLEQVKAYLHEQIEEAKISKTAVAVLNKHDLM
jgi:predicted Fe-S protein YdhL (DUF1289 family)